MATYVIGDIQGCYDEFQALLERISFEAHNDALWLVGDLVNRGPNNIDTLRFIMDLPDVSIVLGNHDLHLVAVAEGFRNQSHSDTIADVLESPLLPDIIEFLRRQPLIHCDESRQFVMTHAGLPPIWDLDTAIQRANEVSAMLASDRYREFLGVMFGNDPDRWSDSLTGFDRLRVIVNLFTRLRFCTKEGALELTSKGSVEPEGYAPWFSYPRPKHESFTLFFGHWAAIGGKTGNDRFKALDTGCVWGGALTAYRLEDGEVFTEPSRQKPKR